jgi:hypothetical protein
VTFLFLNVTDRTGGSDMDRIDAERLTKLTEFARAEGMTIAQIVRSIIRLTIAFNADRDPYAVY